jgi:hypothetical protein
VEKEHYHIQYLDDVSQIVEWTQEDFDRVAADMATGCIISVVNKCIFRLGNIRAITFIPATTPEEELEKQDKVITAEGAYEREMFELLQSQGLIPDDVKIIGVRKGESE